jgi:predicted ATPase/class 3 adenylate cyclase
MTKGSATLPIGTVTFFFTDIAGSTTMVQRLGPVFDEVLAAHNRIVRAAILHAGGTVVRTEGDSFFAVFAAPGASIGAALASQRGLRDHTWPDGGRVEVRMGMHTGDGRLGGDDYVGIDVHRAARVAAAGHGGQILVSEATASLVGRGLPGDVELRDLGEHRLKDMDHPDRIFQLIVADLPSSFPPLRTETVPTNLPAQRSDFVGRAAEVVEVARFVADHRWVTLTGVGGTGKTRLAIEVAASILDRFPGGVYFVALDEVEDHERVLSSIALTLGATGYSDPIAAITAAIGRSDLLLVLDNLEHVVGAGPALAQLLATCRTISVLATSQALLHIKGERVFSVPPLGLPASTDPAAIAASDSGSLLIRRVQQTDSAFKLSEDNAAAVAAIVQRLDGLPLAIELAAARVRLFGVDGLLAELKTRLHALAGGYVDAPGRHQTLYAAIDWSYGLLEPQEQALLRSTSHFVGGFTLDAAEAVCGGPRIPDIVVTLASLLDKSLIKSTIASGTVRFSMLETIRAYGQRRSIEAGEVEGVARAHAQFYTDIPVNAAADFRGPDGYRLMERMGKERGNLAAAFEWSALNDPDMGLAGMLVLARYYQVSGSLDEGRAVANRLLLSTDSSPECRLTGLLGAAAIAYWLLAYPDAEGLYDEAIVLADRLDDIDHLGEALFGLAYTYAWQGRVDEAEDAADRALALAEEADDPFRITQLMAVQGTCLWMRGDLAGSLRRFAEVREQAERIGLVELALKAELVLSGGLIRLGRYGQAAPYILHLLDRFDELADEGGIIESLDYLAVAVTGLAPKDGLRLASSVKAITERRGGTIQLSALGIPDAREVAAASLDSGEVERLWDQGRDLELSDALDLVRDWANRTGISATAVDVDKTLRDVEAATR